MCLLKHLAGARPGWGALPGALPALAPGQSQAQQGGQERGSCRSWLWAGTRRGLLCACHFWSGMLLIKWVGEMTEAIFSPLAYSLDLKGLLFFFSLPWVCRINILVNKIDLLWSICGKGPHTYFGREGRGRKIENCHCLCLEADIPDK